MCTTIAAQTHLDPLVVTATRADVLVSDSPASVSVVTAEQIEKRRAARIGDVLAEVPGLYMRGNSLGSTFPSSGQASIGLRGVPRTTRTLVLVDGQPINNAISGGIDLSSILLENVRRIEVVRGPYSALYGGNAMGGVIHVLTKEPIEREIRAKVESGGGDVTGNAVSFGYRDRLANGLGVVVALGYRDSEGWRDSDLVVKPVVEGIGATPSSGALPTTTPSGVPSAWVGFKGRRPWHHANAEIKLSQNLGAADRLSGALVYAGYAVGYRPPESFLSSTSGNPVFAGSIAPGLPGTGRIQLAETDFLTLTPSFERDWRGHVRWERAFQTGAQLTAQVSRMDHNFRFAQPGSSARYESGGGEWTDQPNHRTDADIHLRWILWDAARATLGAAFSQLRLDRRTQPATQWRDISSVAGENARGIGTGVTTALLGEVEVDLPGNATLHAGGRFDRFRTAGEVRQRIAPAFTTTYQRRSEQRFSPKLALVSRPDPALTLRASIGTGFRPPTLLDLYSKTVSPTTVAGVFSVNEPAPELRAERIRAAEIGGEWRDSTGATISGAVFSQTLTGLIYRSRKSPTLTQSVNAGVAKVAGMELDMRLRLFRTPITLFANVTAFTRNKITENAALPASIGKKLTDTPSRMANLGLEFNQGDLSGSLVARYIGHAFGSGDDTNANVFEGVFGSYDGRTTINGKLAWYVTPKIRLALSIENLTNRQYFDFFKQPGTSAFAEIAFRY